MAQRLWPLGDDPVRANVAKLAGNLMLALAIEAMGEATALTASHGLAAGDFLEIMTSTLFASPSYQRYGGFIATSSFEPGFRLPLGLKDVNLALAAAADGGVSLPGGELVREHMQTAMDRGLDASDWSVFATVLKP
jgi:3-hydroxyisobutyrate dehydrogenase-like beta-hydroxyacid dehydrogenase